jgi:hypothetical protein
MRQCAGVTMCRCANVRHCEPRAARGEAIPSLEKDLLADVLFIFKL